jgi:putative membrane protein
VLPALHTIGGHYTFELVPFGFVTDLFDFERNHYDRLAHFTVGLLAFPMLELLLENGMVRSRIVGWLFPLLAIMAVAAGYEVFEWGYAVMGDPEAGAAVLGSQGDVWDAQKDILADTLGALFALLAYALHARGRPG